MRNILTTIISIQPTKFKQRVLLCHSKKLDRIGEAYSFFSTFSMHDSLRQPFLLNPFVAKTHDLS